MRLIFDGDYPMAFGPMTLDRDLSPNPPKEGVGLAS